MSIAKFINPIYAIGLFILQSYLILNTNFNVWPEIYFFSWLISKGLLPYKDFFDHHGFLLYLILSPLSSIPLIKLFYFLIRTVNLLLFLFLLKKIAKNINIILLSFAYVLISYFFSENVLWFETIITTFYLLICVTLFSRKSKFKVFITSLLISLSSFIKPNAILIAVPLIIITRNFRNIIVPILFWLIILLFYIHNNALTEFLNIFTYNSYLFQNYKPQYISDIKLILSTILIGILAILINISEQPILKETIYYFLFFLFSLIFIFLGYGRIHLLPAITFLFLMIGSILNKKVSFKTKLIIISIVIYSFILVREVKHHYFYLKNNRLIWIEDEGSKYAVNYLIDKKLSNKSIYVFGNHPEIYMHLNILPPTYFPIKFPLTENYFTNYEDNIIKDLRNNSVQYVIVNKPIKEYEKLKVIHQYIRENFNLLINNENIEIHEKKYN